MAITLYPWLHTAYEGTHLGYQIAYLFGRTPYFTPWLHALSQRVRRIALHDMVRKISAHSRDSIEFRSIIHFLH